MRLIGRAFGGVLRIRHLPFVRQQAGLCHVRAGRGGKGVLPGQDHQMRDVEKLRGFGDAPGPAFPARNLVKRDGAQHHDLAGGAETQPWPVERAHQMPDRHHPDTFETADLFPSHHEDVGSAPGPADRGQQGRPERLCHGCGPVLFRKRVHAAPVPIGMPVPGQHGTDRFRCCACQVGIDHAQD